MNPIQPNLFELKLPRLIGDGMILQRDKEINVWGWAVPGESVAVNFLGETHDAVIEDNGKWSVKLPPKKAGGPYNMRIESKTIITIKDILIGDVWVCSGQSNMGLPMVRVSELYADDIALSYNPAIRLFIVPERYDFNMAHDDLQSGRWETVNPESILHFTATGYFFAKALFEKYHVPIGLINASVGGSPIEAWLCEEKGGFIKDKPYKIIVEGQVVDLKGEWQYRVGVIAEPLPEPTFFQYKPLGLFNGMISPLLNYTIKGITWYQGESNISRASEYQKLFFELIDDWRKKWKQGNIPFLYVQLPNYMEAEDCPYKKGWAEIREAQLKTLSVPNTEWQLQSILGSGTTCIL